MPGRNDPCPCGSGKKYKKCCLAKDRDEVDHGINAQRIELAAATSDHPAARIPESILPPAPEPVDPHVAALTARWKEFVNADDEGRRKVFLKTLDEPELMDDEMAFGMLESLRGIAARSGERARFVDLIDLLRERLPDVYNVSRKYYLNWRITMAMAGFQTERLREFTREIAETAGDDVDNYQRVVDLLAYHGELAALSEASRIAWPLIDASRDIVWGQTAYAEWGVNCLVFQRLESSKKSEALDPQFIEDVQFYFEDIDLDEFEKHVARLSGSTTRSWCLEDFNFKTLPKHREDFDDADEFDEDFEDEDDEDFEEEVEDKPIDPAREALAHLLDEFAWYAHQQEGVPYIKAALVRKNIFAYLLKRHDGDLEPRQNMFDAVMNPHKKPKAKPIRIDHPLCPDRETLDRFFSSMLGFMAMKVYDVAATFDLMPAWLRFLETRGLIESSRRQSTLAEIGELQSTLLKLWTSDPDLIALAKNAESWPENAARPCGISMAAENP